MPNLTRVRAPHAAVLLTAAVAMLATACSSSGSGGGKTVTKTAPAPSVPASSSSSSASASSSSASASPTTAPASPVKVTTLNSDGDTYGVGMPVIIFLSRKVTDAKAFQAATKVTANGKPLNASWYFEPSSAGHGPLEGHLRPEHYWPAHSKIHVQFPKAGTSFGKGLASSGSLTSLDFNIGASHIGTVDATTHKLKIVSDGKDYGTFPVSLGASNTPTKRGIKVIMEKGRDISMRGPGYFDPHVTDTQRLTYSGEYLHNAFWNVHNINNGVDSSNGCTNLTPADAKQLYGYLRVGDVVSYPNASGPQMQLGQGYGDWNMNWAQWQTGGAVPTH